MAFGKKKSKGRKTPATDLPMPPALCGLPLPPLPGGAPLPPPPGAAPLPPTPTLPSAPLLDANPPPPAPMHATQPIVASAPSQSASSPTDSKSSGDEDQYSKMWAKRSETPLQQIYGQIDRIGEKDTGSLLDRYSDRFGHHLDREIIVLRGKASEAAKAAVRDSPVVELIIDEDVESADDDESPIDGEEVLIAEESIENDLSSDEEEELQAQLTILEDEIRLLKPKYKLAKSKGNSRQLKKLKPALQTLMNERKLILAVLAGEETMDTLLGDEEGDDEEESDLFLTFVTIVDDLLGKMPSDAIDEFLASEEFNLYQQVASDPSGADDAAREEFFNLVDGKLGEMPEDAINSFVASDDFSIYQEMGAYFRS